MLWVLSDQHMAVLLQDPTTGAVRPSALAEIESLEAAEDDAAEADAESAAEELTVDEEVLQGTVVN